MLRITRSLWAIPFENTNFYKMSRNFWTAPPPINPEAKVQPIDRESRHTRHAHNSTGDRQVWATFNETLHLHDVVVVVLTRSFLFASRVSGRDGSLTRERGGLMSKRILNSHSRRHDRDPGVNGAQKLIWRTKKLMPSIVREDLIDTQWQWRRFRTLINTMRRWF